MSDAFPSMAARDSSPGTCPECGATTPVGTLTCWLCHARLDTGPPFARPALRQRPAVSFGLSTLMAVMSLASVCLGVIVLAPGLGIPLAILLFPVFVRTAMVVRSRTEQGAPVGTWQRIGLFAGSFAASVVMLTVVAVASVGTFCGVCIGLYGAGAKNTATVVALVAATATTLAAAILVVWWIRRRWRKDTTVGLTSPDDPYS